MGVPGRNHDNRQREFAGGHSVQFIYLEIIVKILTLGTDDQSLNTFDLCLKLLFKRNI